MDHVSDDDIEDIHIDFKYYADILGEMIEDGLLTDEQIDKSNLQYLAESRNQDDDFGDGWDVKIILENCHIQRMASTLKKKAAWKEELLFLLPISRFWQIKPPLI